ncbi:hypothetical protein N0V83_005307 [Neocucurbitaria cava]|uniref:Sodium/calcium exchanger membrane region domain-containing protein n=1 Tax=Neocucurbitaria cava TaxID=798079 RepID=A0A9W9CN20_9PLEO|nr:hypothetical protein N0V83_005307 [Neocucurbitaria cava]
MVLWLGLLFSTIGIAASDFFCINLNTISRMLGMSESLAGVTLLALGNGSPDVFSTFAAFRTHAASLAVGELIGAACFITAVVSGSMALIRPFQVARKSFVRDVAFFLVAAAFSMGFIVDGKLHLWESVTMVAFYIFYVAFVVAWHWWLNQRKKRRNRAATMRSHYITPGGDEEEIPEYHDEETTAGGRTPARGLSVDDLSMLERGEDDFDEDDNEEERERWMGELTNNMRVNRPNMGSRRNTHTPIRPSLVGALEFRAVLSSLQKSRNIQSMPISLRRYSDDPTYTTAQQQDNISSTSDPAARPPFDVTSIASDGSPHITRPNREIQQNMGNRARAVSTNDIDNVRFHPSTLQVGVPDITFGPATPNERSRLLTPDIFDKILGAVASLPVLVLTLTLPVVEPQKDDDEGGHPEFSLDLGLPSPRTPLAGSMDSHNRSISFILPPESSADVSLSKQKSKKGTPVSGRQPNGGSFSTTTSQPPEVYITSADNIAQSPEQLPTIPSPSEPKQWNRWLVIVQIFTAPFFIVLILWANLEPDNPHTLIRHTLYSLIASLCVLALVLLTTTPNRPPRWRSLLCFLGFAVAIAWISTIANEVVGVLRTLGVILNMSDAILGLTIFAVGNSLGDLVADITVARLGLPIMALSACFGGPMLNILLGIGLSGCYMTITKGEHRHDKHPDEPVHFKPYHIAVSTTLVISGATLLVTLAGLLVAVPVRKWKMDKMIGWGLIGLWSISTFANVLVEVLGYSEDVN